MNRSTRLRRIHLPLGYPIIIIIFIFNIQGIRYKIMYEYNYGQSLFHTVHFCKTSGDEIRDYE